MPGMVSGESTGPSSHGTAIIYRKHTPLQGKRSISPYADRINYDYFTATGKYPARFIVNLDAGDNAWRHILQGEQAVCVIEVVRGANGYKGSSDYVGAMPHEITGNDIAKGYFKLNNINICRIPEVSVLSEDSKALISWPGIQAAGPNGTVASSVETYSLYRSENKEGPFSFVADVPHTSGNISFYDSSVVPGKTYYYKFRLKYEWPGNIPPYHETSAESAVSRGFSLRWGD